MLAASYRLRMAHSSSSSPLLLSTGARLPALTDSHPCHCTWCCTVTVLSVSLVQATRVMSVSLLFSYSVEYQTRRLFCTVVVVPSEEKQTRSFSMLFFAFYLNKKKTHSLVLILHWFNSVFWIICIFLLNLSRGQHFPVWTLEGSGDCQVKPFPSSQTLPGCLTHQCPAEEDVELHSLAVHGSLPPPHTHTSSSADLCLAVVQMWRSLEMVLRMPTLGFGAPTHSVLSCYTWFSCKGPVPFSATVLSSTSRARRIFLQAPWSQLMEEVAPPGVFLSFRHPGGEVIAQMEREGKAVRSLSAVLTVRRKALAGVKGIP